MKKIKNYLFVSWKILNGNLIKIGDYVFEIETDKMSEISYEFIRKIKEHIKVERDLFNYPVITFMTIIKK